MQQACMCAHVCFLVFHVGVRTKQILRDNAYFPGKQTKKQTTHTKNPTTQKPKTQTYFFFFPRSTEKKSILDKIPSSFRFYYFFSFHHYLIFPCISRLHVLNLFLNIIYHCWFTRRNSRLVISKHYPCFPADTVCSFQQWGENTLTELSAL